MKRGKGPRRKKLPKRYEPSDAAVVGAKIRAKAEFREEAVAQAVCAVCGRADSFDAHHVIEAQYLRQNGHPEYVRPNALRVCDRFSKNRCHPKHTDGSRKIRLKELTIENIEYAVALLGPDKAEVYLRRHYAGNDPRLQRVLQEARE